MKRYLMLLFLVAGCSCGDTKGTTPADGAVDGAADGAVDGAADGATDGSTDAGTNCTSVNAAPTTELPCCTGLAVDPGTGFCAPPATVCGATGATCTVPTDCCTLACGTDSKCSASACTQNGATCSVNTDCCSGVCDGTSHCASAVVSPTCTTTGNACSASTTCCSGNCQGGVCASSGSFCVATNDTCYRSSDCCSSRCSEDGTGKGGVCLALQTMGTGGCTMAGEPCAGCGACCSRACVPTATGGHICALATGCRLEGELCTTSDDCCGGPNSMLAGQGAVTCTKADPGDTYGACHQASGNTPVGDVCKSTTPWCSSSTAPSNCAGCESPKAQCCRVDPGGIPRCYGGSTPSCPAGYNSAPGCPCIASGEQCSFSGECCNGASCLPDGSGVLRCGAACSPAGASCRANGDCCTGLSCEIPSGQITGTCTAPTPPPPVDAGVDSGVDAGTDAGVPVCSLDGQGCSATQACCSGYICESPGGVSSCGATETGCTCFFDVIIN